MFIPTYHPQIDVQGERYNRTLKAMLSCYINDHQQGWDAYDSTLTYAYNSQKRRSTNTRSFYLVLSQRNSDITLESKVPFGKMYNVAEQPAVFLASLYHSLDRAHASLQQTHERYKRDFDRILCKGRERIETGEFVFIDVSNGVTQTSKKGHAAEGRY